MADTRDFSRSSTPLTPESELRERRRSDSPWRDDAYAVVIGINEYVDPKIPDLRFARADAESVHAVLTDPAIGRFKPENVTLLLDAQATERNIRSALGTQLPRRAGSDSTVFIYFAGHGAPVIDPGSRSSDGLEKYLIPHDAVADDLRASGISMDTMQQYFSWLNASQVMCFLDSCYSGSAGGRSFDHPAYQTRAMLSDEFLDSLASEGRFVVTACAANEVSLESPKEGHGIFTQHLVAGLRGAADADENGKVTIDELYEYVYRNVERDARALGGSMKPVKKGSVSGTVYLTEYETPTRKQVRETLRAAAEAWAGGDSAAAGQRWREVLALESAQVEATQGLARVEEVERQRAADIKRKQKMLLGHVNGGALSMREYNRALTLLESDPATLGADDRQRRRFLDSLIAGELTIRSYTRSIDLIETHTGEHQPRESADVPPAAVAPRVVETASAASPPPRASSVPNAERPVVPEVARTVSASPPAPAVAEAARPTVGPGRSRTYAVAGGLAVAAVAIFVAWRALRPSGSIEIEEVVPAAVATSSDTTGGIASTPDDSSTLAPTDVPAEQPRAPTTRRTVVTALPLRSVSMIEPAPRSDVSVGTLVRLVFPDLAAGDRIDPQSVLDNIRVTGGGTSVRWKSGPAGDTIVLVLQPLKEFNTRYTVTVDTAVRTVRGAQLIEPATFTFTTAFLDPQYYYRLTTAARGPNEALSANPNCAMEPAGTSEGQDWYFTRDANGGEHYLMQNAARGDQWALEGAKPPDQCFLVRNVDVATGMLWRPVPAPKPGFFYLRGLNFNDTRSLGLSLIDGKPVPLMLASDPGAADQYWRLSRTRHR